MKSHQSQSDKDIWSHILQKCAKDHGYKERLLRNPNSVLAEEGIQIPKGTDIYFFENDESTLHLVLPKKPAQNISEEELKVISGGNSKYCVQSIETACCACN